jgi:hypothetical protein
MPIKKCKRQLKEDRSKIYNIKYSLKSLSIRLYPIMDKALLHFCIFYWKTKKSRNPLILRGARQVGKTYIIEEFARHEFKNLLVK